MEEGRLTESSWGCDSRRRIWWSNVTGVHDTGGEELVVLYASPVWRAEGWSNIASSTALAPWEHVGSNRANIGVALVVRKDRAGHHYVEGFG